MAGEPPEGLEIEKSKEEESPKGHSSLLRQAVNNRAEDPRTRPGNKSQVSSNQPKTPPVNRNNNDGCSAEGSVALATTSPSAKPRQLRCTLRGQRENSPAPNLADLEFPPPPPPLEEFDSTVHETGSDSSDTCSISPKHLNSHSPRPIPSPRSQAKVAGVQHHSMPSTDLTLDRYEIKEQDEDHFFLGEEVSVEENSLKKNLDGNRRDLKCDSPNTTIESTNSVGMATSKSADSFASDVLLDNDRTGASVRNEERSAVMSQSMLGILRSPSWDENMTDNHAHDAGPLSKLKPVTPRGLRHVDRQFALELKDKTDRTKVSGGSSLENLAPNPPSVNLVSELFENLRLKAGKKPGSSNEAQTEVKPLEAANRTAQPAAVTPAVPVATSVAPPAAAATSKTTSTNKSPLSDSMHETSSADEGPKYDFKSRLRKVAEHDQESVAATPLPAREKSPEGSEEGEDKRKSSGSINSLKRLWEKEQQGKEQNRLSLKSVNNEVVAKPRTEPEKPAVPAKPCVAQKPPIKNSAIYATPTSSVINSKPPVANRNAVYAKTNAVQSDDGNVDKQKIVALCSEVESMLSQSQPTGQWMDLMNNLQGLCSSYADCIAPHGRFSFRQLISKLESQAKEVKQSSSGPLKNSSEYSRLVADVKNTVRDVANALQR